MLNFLRRKQKPPAINTVLVRSLVIKYINDHHYRQLSGEKLNGEVHGILLGRVDADGEATITNSFPVPDILSTHYIKKTMKSWFKEDSLLGWYRTGSNKSVESDVDIQKTLAKSFGSSLMLIQPTGSDQQPTALLSDKNPAGVHHFTQLGLYVEANDNAFSELFVRIALTDSPLDFVSIKNFQDVSGYERHYANLTASAVPQTNPRALPAQTEASRQILTRVIKLRRRGRIQGAYGALKRP
uniref:JAB1/MPN/MOV34 metalloenzyme domain-containing protein n=1 Tax=Ditylenchus dipsaci TaxID=166011 RepID=A0A915EEW0_9BILA